MTEGPTRIDPQQAAQRERAIEAFNAGFLRDSDERQLRRAMEEFAHPDLEWVEDPVWPGGATYRGYDEVLALRADRMDSFDFEQSVEKIIHAGPMTVALVCWLGRAQSSGAAAEMRLAIVTTWREGRIARVEFVFDRERALRIAGIEEAAEVGDR
jgi:ketosteroid isomerase-like protein